MDKHMGFDPHEQTKIVTSSGRTGALQVEGIYTLKGQRAVNPRGGVFIVRYKDGTTCKKTF